MSVQRIERKEYLDKLIAFRDKKLIKVVTGEQIVAVNLEDYDFYELRNPKKLHSYVKERLAKNKMTYVFWMRYSIVKILQGLSTVSI